MEEGAGVKPSSFLGQMGMWLQNFIKIGAGVWISISPTDKQTSVCPFIYIYINFVSPYANLPQSICHMSQFARCRFTLRRFAIWRGRRRLYCLPNQTQPTHLTLRWYLTLRGYDERALVVPLFIVVVWRTDLCMANRLIWRTDHGELTVANRNMAKRHMAKWRIPINFSNKTVILKR